MRNPIMIMEVFPVFMIVPMEAITLCLVFHGSPFT
jgi:hypothetical protein